jgi:hypothetical protein
MLCQDCKSSSIVKTSAIHTMTFTGRNLTYMISDVRAFVHELAVWPFLPQNLCLVICEILPYLRPKLNCCQRMQLQNGEGTFRLNSWCLPITCLMSCPKSSQGKDSYNVSNGNLVNVSITCRILSTCIALD